MIKCTRAYFQKVIPSWCSSTICTGKCRHLCPCGFADHVKRELTTGADLCKRSTFLRAKQSTNDVTTTVKNLQDTRNRIFCTVFRIALKHEDFLLVVIILLNSICSHCVSEQLASSMIQSSVLYIRNLSSFNF